MNRLMLASCLVLFVLSNGLAEEPAKPDHRPKAPGDPIAKVNGAPITLKMLNEAFEERIPVTGHRTLSEKRIVEIQREELNKLITRELVFQEAKKLGLKAGPQEIESEYSKIKARFRTEEQFQENLKKQNLTVSEVREGLERHLLIRKVVAQEVDAKLVITDEQMKEYYDGHKEQFMIPDAVRLKRILVKVDPSGSSKDWADAQKKAEGLIVRAKSTDFSEIARKDSDDDETRSKGGDVGMAHRGMVAPEEVEEAAFALPIGGVSSPIRTLYGYYIIKVEERIPSRQLKFSDLNMDRLRQEMKESAHKRALNSWLSGLQAKAKIEIF